jgi:hypothetical protein
MNDGKKLIAQRDLFNKRFNEQLYDFLDWCSKTFSWIKDFIIYRDIVWGYTAIFKYKLIQNWNQHVNVPFKDEILKENKQYFLNLNKEHMMEQVKDDVDKRQLLEEFDFDKVLHFKELFGRPDFPIEQETKIFKTMQILNKLSEKFIETNEQIERTAF